MNINYKKIQSKVNEFAWLELINLEEISNLNNTEDIIWLINDKALIEIEYPISSGTRIAYIKIVDLFNFIKV